MPTHLAKTALPFDTYLSVYLVLQTKGNLTKHMKSKVHQRKCFEMGIIPVPMTVDESQLDPDMLVHHVEIQEDGKVLRCLMFGGCLIIK